MGIELIKSITIALFFGVVAFLVLLAGYALGLGTSFYGMIIISFVFIGIQWLLGPWIVKLVTGCKPVDRLQHAQLVAMFEELSQKAGFQKPPELYIVESPSPNAFAFGRTKGSSAVAVHTGILKLLTKEELEGVLAHELGHIANGDSTIMTLASSLPVILYYFAYFFVGRNDRNRSAATLLLAFVAAILARILGQLIVLWLSRAREFEADAFSKRITNKPRSLSSALAKITYASAIVPQVKVIEGMQSFYISNPSHDEQMLAQQIASESRGSLDIDKLIEAMERESKSSGILQWFSTHPPTVQRIRKLMAG